MSRPVVGRAPGKRRIGIKRQNAAPQAATGSVPPESSAPAVAALIEREKRIPSPCDQNNPLHQVAAELIAASPSVTHTSQAQPIPGLPFADLKSVFEKPRRWADQYDFDKSDPPTRLFVAASNWMDRAEHAEALLRWCVDHPGECLGDHPQVLLRAKEALKP